MPLCFTFSKYLPENLIINSMHSIILYIIQNMYENLIVILNALPFEWMELKEKQTWEKSH